MMKCWNSILAGLISLTTSYHITLESQNKETLYVTVFVHGAISIRPYLNVPNIVRLVRDKLDNSIYKLSVELIRDDPYIFQTQVMQERGLVQVDMNDDRQSASATLFCHLYDKVLKEIYPERKKTKYYTYGWSGLFSYKSRSKEASEFYHIMKRLRTDLEEKSPKTQIHLTVVGYSHGGNIILGAGREHQKDKNKTLHFDEVMFIGTPVQGETKCYAAEKTLFKKIYHFYSRKDRVVILDFFSTNRFFSKRYFHQSPSQALPENLWQIELRMRGERTYIKKHGRKFTSSSRIIDFSPGHTELWSFGWMESDFRIDFPLYPLPSGMFLPYYKKAVEDYPDKCSHHFITRLQHHSNTLDIFPRFCSTKTELPFLSQKFLNKLYNYVEENRPKEFSKQEYNLHIEKAIEKVQADKICARKEKAKRNLCRLRKIREQPIHCLI